MKQLYQYRIHICELDTERLILLALDPLRANGRAIQCDAEIGEGLIIGFRYRRGIANQQKTAADFDKLAQEAEADTKTRKPGASGGGNSSQHNNGRGGGK